MTNVFSNLSKIDLNSLLKQRNVDLAAIFARWFLILLSIAIVLVTIFLVLRENIKIAGESELIQAQIYQKIENLKPIAVAPRSDMDVKKIANAKIFGALGGAALPVSAPVLPESTSDSLKLVGTYIDDSDPVAIIYDQKSKQQDLFFIEQSVFGAGDLSVISSDFVELLDGAKKIVLRLDDGGGAAPTASTAGSSDDSQNVSLTVDSAKLDEALANLPLTLTQARAVPYFKNGKSVGLRLFAIKNSSLFSEIGLKNGDILKGINGNSLADITQAVKLFEKLKTEQDLTLKLERGKKEVTYNYSIN